MAFEAVALKNMVLHQVLLLGRVFSRHRRLCFTIIFTALCSPPLLAEPLLQLFSLLWDLLADTKDNFWLALSP